MFLWVSVGVCHVWFLKWVVATFFFGELGWGVGFRGLFLIGKLRKMAINGNQKETRLRDDLKPVCAMLLLRVVGDEQAFC